MKIRFKPSPKQWLAYKYLTDNCTNFIGYGGSAFSGKSYLECYWVTIMSLAYPDTGWGLGRRELTTLKKTTLITLFKVFEECDIKPDIDFVYNQQLNLITFNNLSQIFLIDTAYKPSDPLYTRLGGYELTGCAVDESAETDYMAIEILFSRCGRRKNNKYNLTAKMLETFNPSKTHIFRRYYLPYKENRLNDNIVFIPALPSDNPSPDVAPYIQNMLANATETTKQRLIYGNFEYDDDPSTLIEYDAIIKSFESVKKDESKQRYISCDYARYGSDTTVICVWHGMTCKVKQYKGLSVPGCRDEIKRLQAAYSVPTKNVTVDEDGVGGGVVDLLPGCRGFVNNSRAVDDENFDNLKSQCYFKLADAMNRGVVKIDCDAGHKDLIIQELENVKQKSVDKDQKKGVIPKDMVKQLIGRSPDFSDAIAMRFVFEVGVKRGVLRVKGF